MSKSNFIVRGGADFSGIQREMDKTQKGLKRFESGIINSSSGISKAFSGIASGMGLNLGKLGKLALIGMAVRGLYKFGKASIEVAADLVETQNVVDVTFGKMAKDVDAFTETSIKQFGLSTLAAKKHASTMGAMLKSSGIGGKAVRDMSIDLTKLAADMASFYNLDNDAAFQKIMSGMSGMTMPLKELGINMNIANLKAFAMSQGMRKSWEEMSQAEQTMIRYNYLLSVTKDSQGDFARNVNTWSNQVKILKMQWQEFMSLIGKALMEILLPVVKFLNTVLELLIKITKAIGRIYAMITGKEVVAETNADIAESAVEAATGENKLAKGIGKAAKAAMKALAPFDELNILQRNLGSGGGGVGGLGDITTDMGINTVGDSLGDGFNKAKKEARGFFAWFGDMWTKLKDLVTAPIHVPVPIFPALPVPIYSPEWGLDMPYIPSPVIPPIPNPVYEPVWNLTPPPIPAVNYSKFAKSIESMASKSAKVFGDMKSRTETAVQDVGTFVSSSYDRIRQSVSDHLERLRQGQSEVWERVRANTESVTGKIGSGLSTGWTTIESNFNRHKANVGETAAAIGNTLSVNISRGLSTVGRNVNSAITTIQNNLNTFGRGASSIAGEIARSVSANLSAGWQTASRNFSNFANSVGRNLSSFGSGTLRAAAETARGFASNMINGFQTVWNNFRNLVSNIGGRIGGWFSANKSVITKTAIGAGIIVGAGVLALTAPQTIPFAAKALGGLAIIPALAQGGYVGANDPQLALIGDNRLEGEIVTPESKIYEQTLRAVKDGMGSGNGGQPIVINVNTEYGAIGRVVIKSLQDYARQHGELPLPI